MIAFLNLFDLFKSLLIISVKCNSFYYGNIIGFIKVEIKVNSKLIRIVEISENSQGGII